MSELVVNTEQNKKGIYESLLPQIRALMEDDLPPVSNLSNIVAALKQTFNWWWVGFYSVHNNQLVLGPFQGPVACTRIAFGKGVCGTSWEKKETILVDDVDQFPGHIACSAASRSEIVIPVLKNGTVVAVLDVASDKLSHFDSTDRVFLEQLCASIGHLFGE